MALRRGLTTGEALVAVLVLLLFLAIVIPIYRRVEGRRLAGEDVARMRRVFAGIAMYQDDHNAAMPSNLTELTGLVDPQDLISPRDPFAGKAKHYPIEPTLPDLPGKTPRRISYAFLGNYIRAGKGAIKSWRQTTMKTGVLANFWAGDVSVTGTFTATGTGPIERIRMDGSLYVLPERKNPSLSSFEDLFLRVVK